MIFLSIFTLGLTKQEKRVMMNATAENLEIDNKLINFNGPEDDADDDFEGDDFDLEIDSVDGFDDFDDDDF